MPAIEVLLQTEQDTEAKKSSKEASGSSEKGPRMQR
jgi:hypothetical protein